MAKLAEGLEIQVSADISDFKRGMRDVKNEVRGVYGEVLKTGDAAEKASAKGTKGFKAWRSEALFLRGTIMLAVAAIGAIAKPILEAEDAIREFGATAKALGQPFDDVHKSVRDLADAAGVTITTFVDNSKKALVSFSGDAKAALAGVSAALAGAKLGTFSAEEAIAALGPVMVKFKIASNESDDALALLSTTATNTGRTLGEMASVLLALQPEAKKAGVDLFELITSLQFLENRGLSSQDAIDAVKASLQQLGKEKPFDDVDQWEVYRSGLASVLETADPLAGTLEKMFEVAGQGNAALVAAVTGSTELAAAFKDGASSGESYAAAMHSANQAIDAMPELIEAATSKLDVMAETAAKVANAMSTIVKPNSGIDTNGVGFMDLKSDLGMTTGGMVPGSGVGDTVSAMLTPGEYVIRKDVAAKMMPFLAKLNAGGFDPSTLWNLPIAGRKIGKERLLDILGIPQKFGISSGSVNINDPNLSDKQAELSRLNFQMLRALQGYANGGPVTTNNNHNSSIGTVNRQVPGADIETPSGRRRVFQSIARESAAGRKAIGRSRA